MSHSKSIVSLQKQESRTTSGWATTPFGRLAYQQAFGILFLQTEYVREHLQYDVFGQRLELRRGALVLPLDQFGRLYLIPQWRCQPTEVVQSKYFKLLQNELKKLVKSTTSIEEIERVLAPKLDEFLQHTGRISWEIARGFGIPPKDTKATGIKEFMEEYGILSNNLVKVQGEVCDNTTFSLYTIDLYVTDMLSGIDLGQKSKGKKMLLGYPQGFTELELKEMVQKGAIYDAYTLSALTLFSLQKDVLLPALF